MHLQLVFKAKPLKSALITAYGLDATEKLVAVLMQEEH